MQITRLTAVVLRAFLSEPETARYGYDLMRECGLGSGKLYPILDQLERAGWLGRERESAAPHARVRYRLTATGQSSARLELAAGDPVAARRPPGIRILAPEWGHR